jgi:hypothetical protein
MMQFSDIIENILRIRVKAKEALLDYYALASASNTYYQPMYYPIVDSAQLENPTCS